MKKILILMAAVAVGLTSCLKNDDTYERLEPVMPGLEIAQKARVQNHLAMQPASAAFRLGMLLAQAGESQDLDRVMYEGTPVIGLLFDPQTTVEKTAEGYRITFRSDIVGEDGIRRSGSLLVKTNGVGQLADTDPETCWEVVPEAFEMQTIVNISFQTVKMNSGEFRIYANGDGTYTLKGENVVVGFDKATWASDWTSSFRVRPADASLKYAACAGKVYETSGGGEGATCYSYDGQASVSMSYELSEGRYRVISSILSGTEEAALVSSNYDTSAFPVPGVRIVWTTDGNGDRRQMVTYNGRTVTT